jgi:hypothetical protein
MKDFFPPAPPRDLPPLNPIPPRRPRNQPAISCPFFVRAFSLSHDDKAAHPTDFFYFLFLINIRQMNPTKSFFKSGLLSRASPSDATYKGVTQMHIA